MNAIELEYAVESWAQRFRGAPPAGLVEVRALLQKRDFVSAETAFQKLQRSNSTPVRLAECLVKQQKAPSVAAANRTICSGRVTVDGKVQTNPDVLVAPDASVLVRK